MTCTTAFITMADIYANVNTLIFKVLQVLDFPTHCDSIRDLIWLDQENWSKKNSKLCRVGLLQVWD